MSAVEDRYRSSLNLRALARNAHLFAWLAMAITAWAAGRGNFPEPYVGYLFYGELVAIGVLGVFLHNHKCPRCGQRYAVRSDRAHFNSFTLECLTCGLSRDDCSDNKA